ncbi:MAG: sulfite exporter TauE/SafE family protein [Candidatus Gottesmanbacteria bacterium]
MIKEQKYKVSGMHCASCEILIEKELLSFSGVKSAEASLGKGEALIEYEDKKPSLEHLNKIFSDNHYIFSESEDKSGEQIDNKAQTGSSNSDNWLLMAVIVAFLILGFLFIKSSGLTTLINVNANSTLPVFFAFGLLAGFSTCAALVGGIVLSLSKQWGPGKKMPHILFNTGRLVSFAFFGAILGLIGQRLQLSLTFSSVLVMIVSLLMILLAMQMLGIKAVQRFQLSMPKQITRFVASESNFKGQYLPFLLGAGTFLLPCGFTLTVQGLALLSGDPLRGSLIMSSFVLGTVPSLLFIGLTSSKMLASDRLAPQFSRIAGLIVLFFALYNLNSQFNLLGLPSFNDLGGQVGQAQGITTNDLPPLINGLQLIKMDASATGYTPNYFKVRAGVPVRWEINDTGTSGCTNAVISKSLFDGQIDLTPGKISTKEFTPTQPGRYKFSCWMGMINGVMEVVDARGTSTKPQAAFAATTPTEYTSGVKGCGCGGSK